MWEINNFNQATTFVYSIILGIFIRILYDIFRIDRMLFKRKKIFIFFADIAFWGLAAIATFCFLVLTSNGEIRFFALLGELIGYIIAATTISRLINYIFKTIKPFFKKIKRKYQALIEKLSKISFKSFKIK